MHSAHRQLAVALSGTAALELTGCLPSDPFPGQPGSMVLNDSVTALRGASTFTVSGTTTRQGIPTQVNLSISGTGGCKGTISARSGGTIDVVRTRDHSFLRGDEAYMLAQTKDMPEDEASRARKEMSGRWMRTKASDPAMKALGEPFLLKVTTSGPNPFDLTFAGINKPVQVDVPADKDVNDPDDNG